MEYQSSSESEEEPKQLNKKLNKKPPKKLTPIKNGDKKYHEFWTPSRAKDLANFPSPARILLLGPCGVGKTNTIKHLILHARPRFDQVFLVHLDLISKDYDDMDLTDVFDSLVS